MVRPCGITRLTLLAERSQNLILTEIEDMEYSCSRSILSLNI
jgi:hypothetical protein